jgi:hypothetical protein
MIELFGKVWQDMPKRVVNTHEDADHGGETSSLRVLKSLRIEPCRTA